MNRATTVLIVDDDRELREMIQLYLRNEGYEILQASDGKQALELVERHSVDLVVLDRMMPDMDGLQVCIHLRERHQMPVIMLTAKVEDLDKIEGLSVGADDYVTKPFNPLELVARIKAQLRRSRLFQPMSPKEESVFQLQHLTIDPARRLVRKEGREVHLTPREFDILLLLARRPGVVFPSEELYEQVWGEPMLVSANTVMVHIRKIREKVEWDPRNPSVIKTVWGVGYKAEAGMPDRHG
ncbi:DNA-binding response OmpR family regulator [Kroppenstedtia sanguinis]|uniref:response regulator n=1 Tax=Kroppenstedtia sanguinis TaxID=1380684 RepID=UPI003D256470